MMGGTGENDSKPVHKVAISQAFFMGKTEVTQAQWQAVMGALPSKCDYGSLSGEFLGAEGEDWVLDQPVREELVSA